jgi:serine/threonine protein kinase
MNRNDRVIPPEQILLINKHQRDALFFGYSFTKLEDLLGAGHQGYVYKAKVASELTHPNLPLGTDVALKFYKQEIIAQADFPDLIYKRIVREKELAEKLEDKRIVKAYDLCERETSLFRSLFLVMEFVHGYDLHTWLKNKARDGQTTEKTIGTVFCHLCEALKKLHDNSILHRDLKPQNVIIREETELPCIMDLGAARSLADKKYTPSGDFPGAIRYSSPEANAGYIDSNLNDLYSLGAILYDMIFYPRTIFDDYSKKKTKLKLNDAIREQDPIQSDPELLWAKPFWLGLAKQLLEKDPIKRPQDANYLINQLKDEDRYYC